jgi:hypothetical protein
MIIPRGRVGLCLGEKQTEPVDFKGDKDKLINLLDTERKKKLFDFSLKYTVYE